MLLDERRFRQSRTLGRLGLRDVSLPVVRQRRQAGERSAGVGGAPDQVASVHPLAAEIAFQLGHRLGKNLDAAQHRSRRDLHRMGAGEHHARDVEAGLCAVDPDHRPLGTHSRSRQGEPVAGEGQIPVAADAEARSERRLHRLHVRDQSEQPSRHDHRGSPAVERRVHQIGHPLALSGQLDPDRQRHGAGHRRDHGGGAGRIEFGGDRAGPGFAAVRRSDVELECAQAGLVHQASHLDRPREIGHDDARNRIGVLPPGLAVERDGLLEPSVEWNAGKPRARRNGRGGGSIRSPRHRSPLRVEHRVLGALELLARRLGLVRGLEHDGADAGAQRASHVVGIDQMLRRSGDHRVFQAQRADAGFKPRGHVRRSRSGRQEPVS